MITIRISQYINLTNIFIHAIILLKIQKFTDNKQPQKMKKLILIFNNLAIKAGIRKEKKTVLATELITCIKRSDVQFSSTRQDKSRCIVLPYEFNAKVNELVSKKQPTCGLMIYKKDPQDPGKMVVQYIFEIGDGEIVSLFRMSNDQKYKVVLELLKLNPEMGSIEYHTHPQKMDSAVYESFNPGDFPWMTSALNNNKEYIHLLLTPKCFCTFSFGKTKVYFTRNTEQWLAFTARWSRKYKAVFDSKN